MDNSKEISQGSAKYQYLAALVVNFLSFSHGIATGWSSPSGLLLISDDSPLPAGKISLEDASWIASLISAGGLVGNIFFGFITNRYGRKWPLLFLAVPNIIGWFGIWYAQDVYHLYAARTIIGFVGGGTFVLVPLFLTEIAGDRVRGIMGSTIILSLNFGLLGVYIFGTYCDYFFAPKLVIVSTILFAISFCFFPETPSFLIRQNKIVEAEKSFCFYRSLYDTESDRNFLQQEMTKLKNIIGSQSEKSASTSLDWSELTQKPARKALTIGIVIAILSRFCGWFAMLSYTAYIFKEAGSSMSPNISAIVVAVIVIVGSYIATFFVDHPRAGRKILQAISSIGAALGVGTLGVYMLMKSWGYDVEPFNWIPLASFSFGIFIASVGLLNLTYLIIAEIMPEKWKNFGVSLCVGLVWLTAFIATKCLPLLIETLAFHGCMFAFAGVCVLNAIFVICYMPETKGKSHEQIMKSLQ